MAHSRLLSRAAVVGLALAGCTHLAPPPGAGERLDPATQPKFVHALPNPLAHTLVPDVDRHPGADYYEVRMGETRQDLGLRDPETGRPLLTTVWGYGAAGESPTYPGPTFLARQGRPARVRWESALPRDHLLPVDTSVHCGPYKGGHESHCRPYVRTVVHLHGGHVPDHSDGYPEAWFTPGFAETGPHWTREVYDYPNDQEAATLWYHDHAMGITRLNVYAGLAGFYLVTDENEERLVRDGALPARRYDIPLLIQDRSFRRDGSLAYAGDIEEAEGPAEKRREVRDPITEDRVPSIEPEFFGETILVNGKIWPVLEVEPRRYRLRLLNGSNARFYRLTLSSGQPFHQIGTDGGLLDAPVPRRQLLLSPAERADVVVDFGDPALGGRTVVLRNDAPTPFPDGDPVDPQTTGVVMAFRVTLARSDARDAVLPARLRAPIPRHDTAGATTRQLTLVEEKDDYGRVLPLLGTAAQGGLRWDDAITETPRVGDTEIWSVINATGDAHPIHLHLVQFLILDRQPFDREAFEPGKPKTVKPTGQRTPPPKGDAGWKDTAVMQPGEITRVIARFDLPGLYAWHCHILEHEDHEMMRPYRVK
ncbi:copper oxidase [Sulfurifustis variabilis]|uniref:Copper oxidase n=1 Tax=Sulfurifustis variabilis TaxID=1675686 RepID=A0A1B4V1R4_9GAMM|nr:multicopper oxidase [Sulfurifustis variabilis]BAU47383.1 copper oxidase [Sulfurifustis variabilis]